MTPHNPIRFDFDRGSLLLRCVEEQKNLPDFFPFLVYDDRINAYRCHACQYRALIEGLLREEIPYRDKVRQYRILNLSPRENVQPFPYQREACAAWNTEKRGLVSMPTGSGKSMVAAMLMAQTQRSTLIVVPTLDLLRQWKLLLKKNFSVPVGQLGDGERNPEAITVSTYDSACIHAEAIGNRFCFVIFDECHHLAAERHAEMTRHLIAPYRLGLTATLPHDDPYRMGVLEEVVGPEVFTLEIGKLSGTHLAPYRLRSVYVSLTAEERERYEYHRSVYETFRRQVPWTGSWEQFVYTAHRTAEGRRAMKSFAEQKKIATAASEKLRQLEKILLRHRGERILVFTNDNETAHRISCLFLFPVITHETKSVERKLILERFRSGRWPYLVSSRVLNEGVDVPEAKVAVIISGSSTVREHVQRLGRILRKVDGKRAILYEMVTENTGEMNSSRKRRDHEAYR